MKKRILDKLKQQNTYISGEELSNILGVSRTAVWKHINELRKEGYAIESSSKKGYKLTASPDILDEKELIIAKDQQIGRKLIHFDEIDSTNNYAKKIGNEGYPHGTVITAEKQTLGRGRVGREWKSYNNHGLWFSIILKPDMEPEGAQVVTLAAAVAVVEGISEHLGIVCGIKWPNDIIIGNAKLGGILTELSAEPGHINYVVVGIGINVNQEAADFDEEIKNKAQSLRIITGEPISRVKLLGSILKHFEIIYSLLRDGSTGEIIEKCNKYSVTVGKAVRVVFKNVEYIGMAQAIASDGKLIVKCNDGVEREISAGEVQVRGLLGYV